MNLSILKRKVAELPQNPGVYFFRDSKGKILYIGKATNLRSRVASYFRGDKSIVVGRSEWIGSMVSQVTDIDFEQTDSVLEALILESNLIKKHQPKYNTLEKDDKSFSYFAITKEEFPKVLIVRKTDLLKISPLRDKPGAKNFKFKIKNEFKITNDKLPGKNFKYKDVLMSDYYGPYTSKHQMQVALKIIRRIFPFHAGKQKTEKGCLDFQLGFCPGPYADAISKTDYRKNIRGIQMILEGKKKRLVSTLEKEMFVFAKKNEFEKAAVLRNKIYALNHIRDVALMTRDFENQQPVISNQSLVTGYGLPVTNMRIEAYDISNISGQHAVGSMVVFENGAPNKSQYRKFKIKTVEGSNDVAMMKEVLSRRFNNDWTMPDLILLDGGVGHVNMAEKLLHEDLGLSVAIVGVAKGPTRKKLDLRIAGRGLVTSYELRVTKEINSKNNNDSISNILQDDLLVKSIMDEAHRFAITFHRKLRRKGAMQ